MSIRLNLNWSVIGVSRELLVTRMALKTNCNNNVKGGRGYVLHISAYPLIKVCNKTVGEKIQILCYLS